ncbi:cysteine desulfurase [Limibacter armeniacum]|uniref:cysteine desulfurase n=1 Tax=Limibacter armeniacum TaxID=466084 RepID=UPI002FE66118
MIDVQKIKQDFPILHQEVNGHPLVYFDNAATTQKPQSVIDALNQYYTGYNSNVHRGAHALADKATREFEATRETIQKFLNAEHLEEIIFTRGTTEGINLVAATFGKAFINEGDEIIISSLEHHSNIVPWQMLCEQKGAILKVIPVNDNGEIIFEEYLNLLSDKTKLVSVVHASNALGTINPVKDIIREAHKIGAKVLLDGAQSSAHLHIDVQDLDCDFFVFSAHKVFGPTGIGALYGKKDLLNAMPPYQGGGEMIKEVTFEKTTYNELPYKFEAGTPNIADTVAFRHALEYVNELGKDFISARENELLTYATEQLNAIDKVRIIGTAAKKVSVISFVIEGIHPYDIGMMLDARGIAIRTGHHCTQPLMNRFGLEGTARASFAVYNSLEEVDKLVEGIKRIIKMFG